MEQTNKNLTFENNNLLRIVLYRTRRGKLTSMYQYTHIDAMLWDMEVTY